MAVVEAALGKDRVEEETEGTARVAMKSKMTLLNVSSVKTLHC